MVDDHSDTVTGQSTGECQFPDVFRKWHDCRKRHGWCATDSDGHRKRFVGLESLLVVDTYPSVELVMETDFFVGDVLISGELDPVHAQIASSKFRACRDSIDRRSA